MTAPRRRITRTSEPAEMNFEQHTSHLRPVPDSGDSTAPALHGGPEGGILGLTPPVRRGHSRGFITDVLVELGYATSPNVSSRRSRRPAPWARLARGAAARARGDQPATSSRGRSPSATASTTSTSRSTRSTWPPRPCFPISIARRYKAVPVGFVDQQTLLVAVVDPAERARGRRHPDDDRARLPDRRRGRRGRRRVDRPPQHDENAAVRRRSSRTRRKERSRSEPRRCHASCTSRPTTRR